MGGLRRRLRLDLVAGVCCTRGLVLVLLLRLRRSLLIDVLLLMKVLLLRVLGQLILRSLVKLLLTDLIEVILLGWLLVLLVVCG